MEEKPPEAKKSFRLSVTWDFEDKAEGGKSENSEEEENVLFGAGQYGHHQSYVAT